MRVITRKIKEAFEQGKSLKIGNTETDGNRVWLFGNLIIQRQEDTGKVWATLAGWNTPTTRERVNGIAGLGVYQKDFSPMLAGQEIDPGAWFVCC